MNMKPYWEYWSNIIIRAAAIAIALVALVILAGCASVEACKGDVCWNSKTLFKDITDVNVEAHSADGGIFTFEMAGSTVNLTAEQMQAALCLANPSAC